ncbi:MAG: aromatic-ring-hydroxylating dioxygenase subunit beta [Pseudomonadota bacterium]
MASSIDSNAHALHFQVGQFLFAEAEILDEWNVMAWMDMVTSDIDYRIPIRTARDIGQECEVFSGKSFHMIEDYGSLAARMKRIIGGHAFSEIPRSRVRRHVSNVRLKGSSLDGLTVRSNLLFFWARDDLERIVSAERQDTLRWVDGNLKLARRTVLIDHVTLPLPNLSIVL